MLKGEKTMKKMKITAKLYLMVVPLAILSLLILLAFATLIKYVSNNSKDLYYTQLYNANSTLINADRDFYQAYTALLQGLAKDEMGLELSDLISDFDENIDQTEERVASVEKIVLEHAELNAFSFNNTKFDTEYESFKKNVALVESAYNMTTGEGDLVQFDKDFQATRDNISNMEDIIENYATEAEKDLTK